MRRKIDCNEINRLKVKYGNTIEEILDYQGRQAEKMARLEDYETYIQGLKEKMEQEKERLSKACQGLSKIRKSQASILEEAVQKGLEELNFADVRFQIHFETPGNLYGKWNRRCGIYDLPESGSAAASAEGCSLRRRIVQDHAGDPYGDGKTG